jgi:hypothetical protein
MGIKGRQLHGYVMSTLNIHKVLSLCVQVNVYIIEYVVFIYCMYGMYKLC